MSVVFSRASGVFCVSRSFCSCLLGWGAGCGGFWGSGFGAPGCLASFLLGGGSVACFLFVGVGLGCVCARPVPELSGSGCGRGRWSGSGCARRPASCCVVVGVGLCPVSCSCSRCCCRVRGGFSGVVFSVRCFSCLPGSAVLGPLLGCGFRGVGGCGGCRVGLGLFFSPASVVLARACFRFPSWGLVWVWVGFCLESLILAQDERWRRA